MSGPLVSAVFASGLAPWLKPWAAVYASYADDDGYDCFPGIHTVAACLGRHERQTQIATSALRRLGILRQVHPHGPYRSTAYHFIAAALPPRFPQPKLAKDSDSSRFPQHAQAYTGSPVHPKPALQCTRSVSDPSFSTHLRARARKG